MKYILKCFSTSDDPSTSFYLVQPESNDTQIEQIRGISREKKKKAEFSFVAFHAQQATNNIKVPKEVWTNWIEN